MIEPLKKYKIIYADPPWTFKTYSEKGNGRSAEKHYKITALDELKKIRIYDIADNDCILLMWATYPNLKDALELISAWGFKYKTVAFTWVKKNKRNDKYFMGLGYWTRSNPELCLLATKGKPKRCSKSVRNLIVEKIGRHSEKPDNVRTRIIELCGDLPRIELFAREQAEGWDVFGNETNKFSEFELMDWYENQGAMNEAIRI